MSITTRISKSFPISIYNTEGAALPYNLQAFAGGFIWVPAGATATSIALYGAPDLSSGMVFYPIHNVSGALTLTIAASRQVILPDDLWPAGWVKFVGNANEPTLNYYFIGKS